MRQASIIRADLETIDSEPQTWFRRLPPETPPSHRTEVSAYDTRHAVGH
jgi:hypothetical protein